MVVVALFYVSVRHGLLVRFHVMSGLFLSQVYILGYIARAVLYKVPDGSSSENGGVEVQGTLNLDLTNQVFI